MFQGALYPTSVDVDSQTESNHDTALTLACAGGHAELVSLLLAKGADIEHRDKKGESFFCENNTEVTHSLHY